MQVQLKNVAFLLPVLLFACEKDVHISQGGYGHNQHHASYKTKNVIIMVVDGVRYTETWGHPTHQYIPDLANVMAPEGIILTNYWNEGGTYTTAGYTAFCTGFYQEINNSGAQYPYNPGIFQRYRKAAGLADSLVWVVTSKDKLQVLTDCQDSTWAGKYIPANYCGNNGGGLGSGYGNDSLICEKALQILQTDHPRLMLIGFKEPDPSGHSGVWSNYVKNTRSTYRFCRKVWDYLQSDSVYAGSSTVFVTNDHGRHSDGVSNGFISHGDGCEGCRHILLFAAGPDFKKALVLKNSHHQLDVPATVAELLGFTIPGSQGAVMWDLFQ